MTYLAISMTVNWDSTGKAHIPGIEFSSVFALLPLSTMTAAETGSCLL